MKRTKENYWHAYQAWQGENKDDYHRTFSGKLYDEFISLEERTIYLKYSFNAAEASIFCSINIFYIEALIGTYDMEFFLNGEIADDYLDFESVVVKNQIIQVKRSLRIARNALKLGIEAAEVAKITEIPLRYVERLKEK
ncbi:hypothetical protein [Saccharibacillus sacchari]|uniref:hypothetical protein n=1 Tax=Saccharibacillus sacchari TaxID=456493 RepID=UPI0012EB3E35|nr:hypothetical protein [Saccharibacillus sacchari]